ncbi:putative protein MEMO1 [Glarea lozoyensis 74030]|uniref:Protein MEMO1 n=1 Tax=Glarea lozoyensis (strain ATCC 74030 / MF5533) TaxID=1104152 RepID=H0EI88_GLAL7|nr:putative protein MEMO1 [Glarea lozoyensis 74030]
MTTRSASHAGSWYKANRTALSSELEGYLAAVPAAFDEQQLPIPKARVIIAPATVEELKATGKFDSIPRDVDEAEHSLEMHCPYIYTMLSRHFDSPADYPKLVPVMVGNTAPAAEKEYGKLFSSYLADPTSVFVISSDFCHWGGRFRYTYYIPNNPSPEVVSQGGGHNLPKSRNAATPTDPPIHESIEKLDLMLRYHSLALV